MIVYPIAYTAKTQGNYFALVSEYWEMVRLWKKNGAASYEDEQTK